MTYDRSTIAAYVDGELNLVAAKRLEKAISSDPELAQAIAQERALRTRLARHFDPVLDEQVPDALSALLSGKIESLHTPRALNGIACTDGADWKLQHMMAGDKSAQYRQASAGTVAEAAAAMMAGEPLDAPGEAAAKKRGWR